MKTLRYSMEDEKFNELSNWFYQSLAEFSEQELNQHNYSHDLIAKNLKEIEESNPLSD